MIEALDSHYLSVKTRIQSLNPNRQVVGIMDAMDWPPNDAAMEAFYCLAFDAVPIGKQGYSAAVPILIYTLQWTWLIAGTDIQSGVQGRSRGDRYRIQYQMTEEMRYGLFPLFGQKQVVSIDAGGAIIQTPLNPPEFNIWTPPSYGKRVDKPSGLVYGMATVRLTDMTGVLAA